MSTRIPHSNQQLHSHASVGKASCPGLLQRPVRASRGLEWYKSSRAPSVPTFASPGLGDMPLQVCLSGLHSTSSVSSALLLNSTLRAFSHKYANRPQGIYHHHVYPDAGQHVRHGPWSSSHGLDVDIDISMHYCRRHTVLRSRKNST